MHATCAAEATRTLHSEVLVWRFGDLTGEGKSACLAVVTTGGNQAKEEIHAKRGIVIQSDGKEWRELLRFDEQIKNKQGYIGIDFIDPDWHYGFALKSDDQRSDGTKGFTIYFTSLNAKLEPEGTETQVSWNPKAQRFQEYAPNELDPSDFKPEVCNPPVRKSR